MKKFKVGLGLFALICLIIAIIFVLQSEKTLITHPKGVVAQGELRLIVTDYLLMLVVIIPTFMALFFVAYKYRSDKHFNPEIEIKPSAWRVSLLWIFPALVVAVLMTLTWKSAHELDPYRPLESESKPLTIQVVALDWKWLFIYPDQRIATLNLVQFPAAIPVHFKLAADGSPMNSFWIPQLSGQIYAMSGMTTQLHIMADEPGIYSGRAAEINGKGFSDMTFEARASSLSDFEDWVASVKQSPQELTLPIYEQLTKPEINKEIVFYSDVESDLFKHIMMKYMHP